MWWKLPIAASLIGNGSDMEHIGLLNICKLPGMSSHSVVAVVRRLSGIKRVGHTGTLDPSACGVLPICVGSATRLADYVSAGPKTYRAEFSFGVTTDSLDVEGTVTSRVTATGLTESAVLAALPQFVGIQQQRPPIHSAVQIGGRRAYDMARNGEEVTLPSREVTIYAFEAVRYQDGKIPRLLADITCSKGTYIRSMARDLGDAVGTGATLTFLARTQVGQCRLADAVTLDELASAGPAGFAAFLQSPDLALPHLPVVTLTSTGEQYRQGNAVPTTAPAGLYRVYLVDWFLGLGRSEDGTLRAVVNLYHANRSVKSEESPQ